MSFNNKFDLRQLIKVIVAIKIVVLTVVLAVEFGGFYIGDAPLSASVDNEAEESSDDENSEAGEENTEKAPKKSSAKRKSFLENLLNLPEINPSDSKNDEIGKYLSLVERKRQQIEERLDLLESRESHLLKIESTIDEKLARLEEERLFFGQTIQKEKKVQADRLDKLVTLYGKMEAKKAGPVIETLDKDLVVALFDRMQQKKVTKILEVMTPNRSKELTEYFGRIRSGKEYDLLKEMNQSLRSAFDSCKGMP